MTEFAASIVLASYRLGGLDIFLPSASKQDAKFNFEVVIADELYQQRKDALKQYLEKFPDLVVQHVPAPAHDFISVARSFNAGLKAARGDVVVILGDYSWVPPQYLKRMVEQVDENKKLAPVAGYVDHEGPEQVESPTFDKNCISTFVEPFDDAKLAWFLDVDTDRVRRFEDREIYVHEWLPDGRGMLMDEWVLGLIALPRHIIVDRLNGFDEVFCYGRGYSDYDLVYRTERLGWRFVYNPRLMVHRVWQSKGQLIDKRSIREWNVNKEIMLEKRGLLAEGVLNVDSHRGIEDRRYKQARSFVVIGGGAGQWVRRSVRALQLNGLRVLVHEKGHRYDPVTDFMVYGVSPGDVMTFQDVTRRRVWYWWTGSDVWNLVNGTYGMAPAAIPRGGLVRHLCVHERLREELASVGIESDVLMDVPDDPLASEDDVVNDPVWSDQTKRVLVYMPVARHSFYGYFEVLSVAKELPDVQFSLIGTGNETRIGEQMNGAGLELFGLPNVKDLGNVPATLMEGIIRQHHIHYRPTVHDGLPYTLVEAKRLGRHVVMNYAYPHCLFAPTPQDAVRSMTSYVTSRPDFDGMKFYRKQFSTRVFASEFDRIVVGRM